MKISFVKKIEDSDSSYISITKEGDLANCVLCFDNNLQIVITRWKSDNSNYFYYAPENDNLLLSEIYHTIKTNNIKNIVVSYVGNSKLNSLNLIFDETVYKLNKHFYYENHI